MSEILPITVIMSTYSNVQSEWLNESIASTINQSSPPAAIIVVIDGAVDCAQHEVLKSFEKNQGITLIKLIYVNENKGLASSMNLALKYVETPWVARMDSDDICSSERFQIQYSKAIALDVDVVCSWHSEFLQDKSNVYALKKTPETDLLIRHKLNFRNVISHPTLLVKTSLMRLIGGYDVNVGLLEDYDLYLRLAEVGARFIAIQQPLVFVRVSNEQFSRRGGGSYLIKEISFRWLAFLHGRVTFQGFIVGLFVYPLFRMMPVQIKSRLYGFVRTKT